MKKMTFKDLPLGASFCWEDTGSWDVDAPPTKIGEYIYNDPGANACKHPLRLREDDRTRGVYCLSEGDRAAAPGLSGSSASRLRQCSNS